MTINIADTPAFPPHAIGKEQVICQGAFTWTSGGAIASSSVDDPGMTLANKSGTGLHALTFPKSPEVRLGFQLVSASLTVSEAICTAIDATAGTATVRLSKAGTATDAASGNILHVTVYGKVY